jgi:hypothetical protein
MPIFITLSIILLVLTFLIIKIRSTTRKKTEEVKPEKVKKFKIGETLSEFKRVERFDSEAYVEGTFETVLHDIKSDIEGNFNTWELKIDYSKIQFEKIKYRSQWDKCKITLNIDYSDYDEFEIKGIDLSTSSKTFSMKDINSEYYRFIYECYVKYINERNTQEKERVDKSLSDINEIIGIDNLRDIKLDQILNGE